MRKLTYLAVFEPTETGYSVYFPDLPGCVSYGEDFEAARQQATEALELHVYGMEKDGDELPLPSKSPQVDPETAAGYLVSPITVFPDLVRNELDNRAVKTNLTIPAWLKELAEAQGVNYSKIFQTALMDYLGVSQPSRQDRDK
ncbi:type II toxin-antitoxin system HicB family antitoxin [Hydrogenispora ethanolica]|nr:type II toxin-antitoxin system HicB family antitoxin [Hydrogenispora ethanolica]